MNNYQVQQMWNDVIGFSMFAIMAAFMVGMVKPMGEFFEPSYKPEKHLPEPVVKEVTVPGGSYWKCSTCGKELPPGTKVFKAGKEVYCSIMCIKLPEHHSSGEIEPVILEPFFEAEEGLYIMEYKGETIGALNTAIIGDSLVVLALTVDEPEVVTKGFLFTLFNELEKIARAENLRRIKVEYKPEHKRMYELAGFTQSYEEGEAGMVVKYVG